MTVMTHDPKKQRLEALEKAQSVRLEIAGWRRELTGFTKDEAVLRVRSQLLEGFPGRLERMTVDYMLRSIPHFGTTKIRRVLREVFPHCATSGFKRLDELTGAQRTRLHDRLGRPA